MIWVILILVGLFLFYLWLRKFKLPKVGSLVLITGGVKAGKSSLSVDLLESKLKRNLRAVRFRNFFRKIMKKPLYELPLLYSNVPLTIPYVPLTTDYFLRKKRFNYGSIVYVQEASLVADSQLIKDMVLNNEMLEFFKLIGHELGSGGCMILDTQTIQDLHYSIKRSCSQYFYVHHCKPLFLLPYIIVYLREFSYSEDNNVSNNFNDDVEEGLKKVLIHKRVWKRFDAYCYSSLTDSLSNECQLYVRDKDDLKVHPVDIVTFNPFRREKYHAKKKY